MCVGPEASGKHAGEEREGWAGAVGLRVKANHSVVGEDGGPVDATEDAFSIGDEWGREGGEGEDQVLAQVGARDGSAGTQGPGVYLLEGGEGGA